uniref:Adenosine 3'-phospho 5'-phosphosulfate transporter 1 n=1 Tax=Panagrellus redivivus TaxID=6233 RepID=A0A7E4V795_PANRE
MIAFHLSRTFNMGTLEDINTATVIVATAISEYLWFFRFFFNLLAYSTVIIPTILLVKWVQNHHRDSEFYHRTRLGAFLRLFAVGRPEYQLIPDEKRSDVDVRLDKDDIPEMVPIVKSSNRFSNDTFMLILCFGLIQCFFVPMGFFQEHIMTQLYPRFDDSGVEDKFHDTEFLLLLNRLVALVICVLLLFYDYKNQPAHVPPLYKHSFGSMSNTLSSLCQYEAMKYMSFPALTVGKASKLIPTMIMGKIVRNKTYTTKDYIVASMLVTGVAFFFLSTPSFKQAGKRAGATETTISGLILMAGYLAFDAFTPNWQKKLFDCKPPVSKTQMMLGVNFFSAVLCVVSLLMQGTLFSSISFALNHDGFARNAFLCSFFGACGQFAIYQSIKRFGPEFFAICMTVRQILSIILSAFYFSHPISPTGIIGLCIVFGAIFYSKLCGRLSGSKLRS